MADIPLVDGVPSGTANGAGKVVENHPSYAPRAVVDGRSEAVCATSITGIAGVGCRVWPSCRRAYQPAKIRTEIASVSAGCALIIGCS